MAKLTPKERFARNNDAWRRSRRNPERREAMASHTWESCVCTECNAGYDPETGVTHDADGQWVPPDTRCPGRPLAGLRPGGTISFGGKVVGVVTEINIHPTPPRVPPCAHRWDGQGEHRRCVRCERYAVGYAAVADPEQDRDFCSDQCATKRAKCSHFWEPALGGGLRCTLCEEAM